MKLEKKKKKKKKKKGGRGVRGRNRPLDARKGNCLHSPTGRSKKGGLLKQEHRQPELQHGKNEQETEVNSRR